MSEFFNIFSNEIYVEISCAAYCFWDNFLHDFLMNMVKILYYNFLLITKIYIKKL